MSYDRELDNLIARAQRGDRAAFDLIVRRRGEDVARYCLALTRSYEAARDLAQDAWLKAWRNLHRFRRGGYFLTWVKTIVYHEYVTDYRRRRLENAHPGRPPEAPADPSAQAETRDLLDRVKEIGRASCRERV